MKQIVIVILLILIFAGTCFGDQRRVMMAMWEFELMAIEGFNYSEFRKIKKEIIRSINELDENQRTEFWDLKARCERILIYCEWIDFYFTTKNFNVAPYLKLMINNTKYLEIIWDMERPKGL